MAYQILTTTAASITDLKKIRWEPLPTETVKRSRSSIATNRRSTAFPLSFLHTIANWPKMRSSIKSLMSA